VLGDVEVEEELDQGAFEAGAPIGVEEEAAAGEFGSAGEVHEFEGFAEFDVGLGREIEMGFGAVDADFGVVGGALAGDDGCVREVGDGEHEGVALGIGSGGEFVELGDAVAEVAGFLFAGVGFGDFFLAHEGADFLGDAVALGFEGLDFGEDFPALFIGLEDCVNEFFVPCPTGGEALANEIGFFADEFDVEHGEIIEIKSSAARRTS